MMTCLTLSADVAEEAVEQRAQLVVSHHPLLFRPVQTITGETEEGRVLLWIIEAGIAVYSPHTAYDSAELGINQQLAEMLGLAQRRTARSKSSNIGKRGGNRFGPLRRSCKTAAARRIARPRQAEAVRESLAVCGRLIVDREANWHRLRLGSRVHGRGSRKRLRCAADGRSQVSCVRRSTVAGHRLDSRRPLRHRAAGSRAARGDSCAAIPQFASLGQRARSRPIADRVGFKTKTRRPPRIQFNKARHAKQFCNSSCSL